MVTDSDAPWRGRADVWSFLFFSSGDGRPAKEPKEQWHSLSGESAEDKSGPVRCANPSAEQIPVSTAGLLPSLCSLHPPGVGCLSRALPGALSFPYTMDAAGSINWRCCWEPSAADYCKLYGCFTLRVKQCVPLLMCLDPPKVCLGMSPSQTPLCWHCGMEAVCECCQNSPGTVGPFWRGVGASCETL